MSVPIRRLTTSQRPMFLVNSRHRHLSATAFSSQSKYDHQKRHPFSRSYGVILPSSLTRVLSSALGYSPHPPVLVCGTVHIISHLEAFLGSIGSITYVLRLGITSRNKEIRICLDLIPTSLHRLFQQPDDLPSCVPPSLKQYYAGTGILTRFPSTTLFSLALGAD